MSTPTEYYHSLPPVSKTFGLACLMTTTAYYLGLYDVSNIALYYGLVFKRFQIWRLITNFFFLGNFTFPISYHLIMIAKYGVELERGPFHRRTADFLWMLIFGALSLLVMGVVPYLWSPFMGFSLVSMIVYVWSREFPDAVINIEGRMGAVPYIWSPFTVSLKSLYLPWAMLAMDLMFGTPSIMADILGMAVGHLYYFLAVLHPRAGGNFYINTPLWVHKIVAYWGEGNQINAPVQSNPSDEIVFRGRSNRLGRAQSTRVRRTPQEETSGSDSSPHRQNQGDGIAFRGRGYRLNE